MANAYLMVTPVHCPRCQEHLGDYRRYEDTESAIVIQQARIEKVLTAHVCEEKPSV